MDFEEFCKENNYDYEHELLKIYAFYKLIAIKMEDWISANKYCPESLTNYLLCDDEIYIAIGRDDIIQHIYQLVEFDMMVNINIEDKVDNISNTINEIYNPLDCCTGSCLYTLKRNYMGQYSYEPIYQSIDVCITFPEEFENYTDDDLQLVLELK